MYALLLQPVSQGIGSLLGGIAAMATAAIAVWTFLLKRRADEAKSRANRAELTATAISTKVDKIAGDDGTLAVLRKEVGGLQEQIVEISRSTSEQLAAAATAITACGARHEQKDALLEALDGRVHELSKAVVTLHGTLHFIHPDLVAEDPSEGT